MADEVVRYIVKIDGQQQAAAGLMGIESSAVRAEASIAQLNATLGNVAGALGVGIGLHQLVRFGQDAVEGAADYETAVKRIKFASENLYEGQKNVMFIRGEVDKFKIPLQEATDAYGKFLAMLAGSGIEGEKVRKLHDQLLLIGKIKGLDDGQMNAAVMNLGKMLESGSLDARHFRPLEQQLSGIGAFVAKELGISVHQLAILRNKGKMTTIDPKVLLSAIEKQAASLEQFLPESLGTIRSDINDLNNDWSTFKNNLVFDNRAELRSLFETLKEGVGWLKDHESSIINIGKNVAFVTTVWLEYKGAMLLVNGAVAVYEGFMTGLTAKESAETLAIGERTVATNLLTAAIERLNFAQMSMAGVSGLAGKYGQAGIPLLNAAETMGGVIAAEEGVATAAATFSGIGIAILGTIIAQNTIFKNLGKNPTLADMEAMRNEQMRNEDDPIVKQLREIEINTQGLRNWGVNTSNGSITGTMTWDEWKKANAPNKKGDVTIPGLGIVPDYTFNKNRDAAAAKKYNKDHGIADESTDKIVPPTDHVTGQRLTSYYITIKELNGIKQNTVQEGGKMDVPKVAETLRDIIISIVNDSQIRAGN